MKFSVCVDAVFFQKDIYESLNVIKECGFDTFEFWSWWDKDVQKLREVKNNLSLNISTCCTKFESLVDPLKRDNYINGLRDSIDVSKKLGITMLISQTGNDTGQDRIIQRRSLIDGLKKCVPMLEENNITLLLEPLNIDIDHKGYYLYLSEEAFDIVKEIDSKNIKILFDIYHQQITEGDLLRRIIPNIEYIGHFHAAGNTGRNELCKGEINYPYIFKAIKESGYDGYIGLEYFCIEEPSVGLRNTLSMI